jgi:alkylation response protein AidB-like acyl-CoA dehydrogenase
MAEAALGLREKPAEEEPRAVIRPPPKDDFLSAEEVQSLTPAVLKSRTMALKSLLARDAAQAERDRRPTDEVWSALRQSGIFYQFVPKRFGGLEFTPEQFFDVMVPLAEGDPSMGWAACFCTSHNWFLAQFPEQAQEEIWTERPYITAPDVTFPPGRAVAEAGGYRVSGRWKWGSGVMNSDWSFVKALVDTPEGPQMGHFIVPTSDVDVIDVWHVDGMCATGSNDIRVKDLFVPAHRMTWLRPGQVGQGLSLKIHPDSRLYRMPMLSLLTISAAVPSLGAARACRHHLAERLKIHVTVGTDSRQADRVAPQMRLARADVMIRTAELVLRTCAREGYELSDVSEPEQTAERIRLRAQVAYAVGLCRDAITVLCDCAGSSLHFLSNPMQRYRRDVEVMASHIVYDLDQACELHGRSILGLPPNSMLA